MTADARGVSAKVIMSLCFREYESESKITSLTTNVVYSTCTVTYLPGTGNDRFKLIVSLLLRLQGV